MVRILFIILQIFISCYAIGNNVQHNKDFNPFYFDVPIGTESKPANSKVKLVLVRKIQSYNQYPDSKYNIYNRHISSPKSALINEQNNHTYINSLENYKTLVYDSDSFNLVKVIYHKFDKSSEKIFVNSKFDFDYPDNRIKDLNHFKGKPVEMTLSHGGRYLWITYYRRSYDLYARFASAVALIDTNNYQFVKVYPTGAVSKYVEASPNGKYLAVGNWGENTVLILNIENDNPKKFNYDKLLVVEKKYRPTKFLNRDRDCGFCIRGLSFSNDDRYLFVSRMKREGIHLFKLENERVVDMGALMGYCRAPRDIQTSSDGEYIYVSCTASGILLKMRISKVINLLSSYVPGKQGSKHLRLKRNEPGIHKVFVGMGPRTLKLSGDGKYAFVSINIKSEIAVVETTSMKVISKIINDSYPVGLDVSSDGTILWVTSQGKRGKGGNAINIYRIQYKD